MQTQSADSQAAMTPDSALQALREGNERFVASKQADRNLQLQVSETTKGQWPFAVVLGCIDSRVPPEMVFDQGIGDIFSARIAGNCITEEIVGSIEFGCKVAGARLLVVLGHSHCGAIKGACDGVEMSHLTTLLGRLKPAVDATPEPADAAQRTSGNPAFVQTVADNNVKSMVEQLPTFSPVLGEMVAAGEIKIVGAMYDIETGKVRWFE